MRFSPATLAFVAYTTFVQAATECPHKPSSENPTAGILAVYSPLHAEVPAGQPYDITWDKSDGNSIASVSIVLCQGPSTNCVDIACIANSVSNTGSYSWNVPSDLTVSANNEGYGLKIIDDKSGQFQYSTQFGVSNEAKAKPKPKPSSAKVPEEEKTKGTVVATHKHATATITHLHPHYAATIHHPKPTHTGSVKEEHEKANEHKPKPTHIFKPSHGSIHNSANATTFSHAPKLPKTKTVQGKGSLEESLQILQATKSKTHPTTVPPVTSVDVATAGGATNPPVVPTAAPAPPSSTPQLSSGAAGRMVGGVVAGVVAVGMVVQLL
ncbi:hypothetical protein MMC21_000688 [Puttea exsequens]|nr:hypothetical protein [Puttea exsequens]